MTDLEISKALALAIGWREDQVVDGDEVFIEFNVNDPGYDFRIFDYRDWNVISPIAERFDCFPSIGYPNSDTPWESLSVHNYELVRADTPQKAIALAVINGSKK